MFFLYKESYESPGRATTKFPIKGVCCNAGTLEAVLRWASSGSVGAGHDIEWPNDKARTIKERQHEEGQAKGKARRAAGDVHGTKHKSRGVLVMSNFSGKC